MDLTSEFQTALKESERRARYHESKGSLERAASEYARSAHLLGQIAKQTRGIGLRRQRMQRAQQYTERANTLRRGESSGRSKMTEVFRDQERDLDQLSERVRSLVRKTTIGWDQIAGLKDVRSQIRSLFAIALAQRPVDVIVEQRPNVLLYGPPGTGKTLIAAAASGSLEATFFSVKAGDLLSKNFGESPQLVARLYEEALQTAPSVVFVDEIEALVPDRDAPGGVTGPEARILAQFLAELDGLDSKAATEIVITIAATNKPWLLDEAVLSRFARSVYVPLPDHEGRREIFRLSIGGNGYESEASLDELAAAADGKSGREIATACKEAARNMLMRANPELDYRADQGIDALRSYQLKTRPISKLEIMGALSQIRASSDAHDLARYESWMSVT